MTKTKTVFLAGDIGGTKTDLAVFSSAAGIRAPLAQAAFASRNYPGLEAPLRDVLSRVESRVDGACFAVAGPVLNGSARITNLPWVLDEVELAGALGLSRVRLLNDLEAVAAAVPLLSTSELFTLNRGRAAPGGAIAVIAPGTGLGEAYLVWDGARYRAFPSEGGHADFAPTNAREAGLLEYLSKRFEHVSYERVCSGMGLPNIHAYLKASGIAGESDRVSERVAAAEDPTPVIVAAALDGEQPCALCRAALEMFVSILGAEAGNLALKVMASGGVYLGGGILPRMLPALSSGLLMAAFGRKGRASPLLEEIPVHVILNPRAALLGAAHSAMACG